MKTVSIGMTVLALLFVSCQDKNQDPHAISQNVISLAPLVYTKYSDKSELFLEFKPFIVGTKTNFAAHFTLLGDLFLPLIEGEITASLIIGDNGVRSSVNKASSPGIFRLSLIPKFTGSGRLIFDIKTANFTDQIIIDNVIVYASDQDALDNQIEEQKADNITYLKEQAWKVEFANAPVVGGSFVDIIKTSGQILSAPGDEMFVIANASGILNFAGNKTIAGSPIAQGRTLFSISGGNLAENNMDTRLKEVKTNFEKSKSDFDRAKELISDKIISDAEYLQSKNAFDNAKIMLDGLTRNYTSSGQIVKATMGGYVKNILVNEGQYVSVGEPLMVISKNRKLILEAHISQKYFNLLPTISSANFKLVGNEQLFDTESINGRVLSYGKSIKENDAFLPLYFEIDNIGSLVPGSVAEIFLKTNSILNAMVIPQSALIEEQGKYYVMVQVSGESFDKREVKLGGSDGERIQVISGIKEGERIVIKGAYQIKLAAASGALPAHGHEH